MSRPAKMPFPEQERHFLSSDHVEPLLNWLATVPDQTLLIAGTYRVRDLVADLMEILDGTRRDNYDAMYDS